jgi:hypothetical protein
MSVFMWKKIVSAMWSRLDKAHELFCVVIRSSNLSFYNNLIARQPASETSCSLRVLFRK